MINKISSRVAIVGFSERATNAGGRGQGLGRDGGCGVGNSGCGEAVITGGYASKAKWIVHAVAPQATHQGSGDHAMLAMAYRNSLLLADAAGAKSIAFPSLGTRVSGWEVRKAAGHALHNGIFSLLLQLSSIESVTLCCFCEHDADDYRVGRERLLYDEGMLETLGEG